MTPLLHVGRVYMLRGGHLLRYHGRYAGPPAHEDGPCTRIGPCLAFQPPDAPLSDPPVGASVAAEDVLYEVTREHEPMLRHRIADARPRGLADDAEHVLVELGLEASR